jgi:hypothetical protein
MSNPRTEQEEIELETITMEHHLKMGEAMDRLRNNPDFQTVILDGYLKDKVLASVSLLAVPQIKDAGKRTDQMEDLISASNLQYFFQMIDNFHEGCKDPILSDDEEQELVDAQNSNGVN